VSLFFQLTHKEVSMPRYAIYYCPDTTSHWWETWSKWLGRYPDQEEEIPQLQCPGISKERFYQFTENPRRYGLHATLKAPFFLNQTSTFDDVLKATYQICQQHTPFEIDLELLLYGDFLALVSKTSSNSLQLLERDLVIQLDSFRLTLTDIQLNQRRSLGLSPREDQLLQEWGYPFVLDCFQFHLSLTGSLKKATKEEIEAMTNFAQMQFRALRDKIIKIDSICIFEELEENSKLILKKRIPLLKP
jgi:hypothetical protein